MIISSEKIAENKESKDEKGKMRSPVLWHKDHSVKLDMEDDEEDVATERSSYIVTGCCMLLITLIAVSVGFARFYLAPSDARLNGLDLNIASNIVKLDADKACTKSAIKNDGTGSAIVKRVKPVTKKVKNFKSAGGILSNKVEVKEFMSRIEKIMKDERKRECHRKKPANPIIMHLVDNSDILAAYVVFGMLTVMGISCGAFYFFPLSQALKKQHKIARAHLIGRISEMEKINKSWENIPSQCLAHKIKEVTEKLKESLHLLEPGIENKMKFTISALFYCVMVFIGVAMPFFIRFICKNCIVNYFDSSI